MLYVFVEGPDDYNFFDKLFCEEFGEYKIINYARMPKIKVNNYLKSITSTPGCSYLFFGDEDGKGIETRRSEILNEFECLEDESLHIVQYEIESWYYAGVNQENCKSLKIKHFEFNTDSLTKEMFYSKLLRPSERKYVMAQMLELYSKELASERNTSFSIFRSEINKESAAVS